MNKVPCRSDVPYNFTCLYCGKLAFVTPVTGDRRFRYCCKKCRDGYWEAHRAKREGRKRGK